jgi:hypothetical protein
VARPPIQDRSSDLPVVRRQILVDIELVVRDRDDEIGSGLETLEACHAGWVLVDGNCVAGLSGPTGERWRKLSVGLVRADAQRENNQPGVHPAMALAPV